jgi:hypothetical protein
MKRYLPAITLTLGLACLAAPAFAQDTATIQQNGDSSAAAITQAANFGINDASIRQGPGTGNGAQIMQTFLGTPLFDTSAFARIEQDGNRNNATVGQTQSGRVSGSIVQLGDDNRAMSNIQNSDRSGSAIEQTGFGNQAAVTQFALVEEAGVFVQQVGDGNNSTVNQHEGGFLSTNLRVAGNNNTANIDQSGTLGTIDIAQNGNNGMVMVTQVNMGLLENAVTVTQGGTYNVATVSQVGNGFTANITQGPGSFNTATINQSF